MISNTGNRDEAVQAFAKQAQEYWVGITDADARKYAQDYSAALEQWARNGEWEEPQNPGLFEPHRKLIRTTLNSLLKKHVRITVRNGKPRRQEANRAQKNQVEACLQ